MDRAGRQPGNGGNWNMVMELEKKYLRLHRNDQVIFYLEKERKYLKDEGATITFFY